MKDQEPVISAVVFDLDGLMLNTEDVFDLSGRELLKRRGLTMTPEIHQSMLGRRPNEAFQALKELTGISDSIDRLKEETKELFRGFAKNHLAMMDGLPELLQQIEKRDLPKAVATSSPRAYLEDMLTRFNLQDRFLFTLTAEDVTAGKPDPEIYLTAASRLQAHPTNIVVLEDSETGTRAASAAGTIACSIPNRHTRDGDFSSASYVFSSLKDPQLVALIGS